MSATSSYLGTTSSAPNIAGPQTCLGNDGQNVVGFGNLDVGIVAFSCWWFTGTTNVEADMLLNKHDFDWTDQRSVTCTDAVPACGPSPRTSSATSTGWRTCRSSSIPI